MIWRKKMDLATVEIPEELVVELDADMQKALRTRFTPTGEICKIEVECPLCAKHKVVLGESEYLCTGCPFEKFVDPMDSGNRGCSMWLDKIMRILDYKRFHTQLFIGKITWDPCFDDIVREQMAKLLELVFEHKKAVSWV